MDTTLLRMIATASTLVDGFTPERWTQLTDPRGTRLLVSDGSRSLVVSLVHTDSALDAEAEKLAAAVARSVVEPAVVHFPVYVAAKSFAAGDLAEADSTVIVTEPLPGRPLSTQALVDTPELIDSLATVLARLHSADTGAVADAGLVTLEPQEIREQLLNDLDRGAQTGRVPQFLLQRWEEVLETPAIWHFLPAVVHGSLGVDAIRYADSDIVALNDLHGLRVGDPAVDLALVAELMDPEAFMRFLHTYESAVRTGDKHIAERIEFRSELAVLQYLLSTVDARDENGIAEAEEMLAELAKLLDDDSTGQDVIRDPSSVATDTETFRPSAPRHEDPVRDQPDHGSGH